MFPCIPNPFIWPIFSAVPYWIWKVSSPSPPKSWEFIYALTNMQENKGRLLLISFNWKDRCRCKRDTVRDTSSFQPFVSSSQYYIFRFAYYSTCYYKWNEMNKYGASLLQTWFYSSGPAAIGQFKHAEEGQFSLLSKKTSSFADKIQLPPLTVAESTSPQSQFIKGGFPFFLLEH